MEVQQQESDRTASAVARRRSIWILRTIGLSAAYVLAAKFDLGLDVVSGFATLIWLPTGLALAALLLWGYDVWPGVFVGSFSAHILLGMSLPVALGIAVGNTLGVVVGAWLLKRVSFRPMFQDIRDTMFFILYGVIFATALSSTIGVSSLYFGGTLPAGAYVHAWVTWWRCDMLGVLIITPFILSWSTVRAEHFRHKGRWVAAFAMFFFLALVDVALFAGNTDLVPSNPELIIVVFLPLMFLAIIFGTQAVTTGLLVTSFIVVWGTVNGTGPFAVSLLGEYLFPLQLFLGLNAGTLLLVAAIVQERNAANEKLEALNDALKATIRERSRMLLEAENIAHVGGWEWDIASNVMNWSDEFYRVYGLERGRFDATYEGLLKCAHPDDRAMVSGEVEKALKTGEPFAFTHRIILPDGSVRFLHTEGRVLTDGKGRPVRMYGTVQDITERKIIADELEARTADLEKLNKMMVGREVKMTKLKDEMKKLYGGDGEDAVAPKGPTDV